MSLIYNDLLYQCMQAFYYDPKNGAMAHPVSDPINSQLALDKPTNLKYNTNMCDSNIHFVTAVLLTVGELRKNPFSIYQVTKRLREQVNQGELSFVDREVEDVEGNQTYRVDHVEVRSVFRELMDNNILTGLSSRDAGPYMEYYDTVNVDASPLPKGVVDASGPCCCAVAPQASTQSLINCAGQVTSSQTQKAVVVMSDDIQLRVKLIDYLRGKSGKGIVNMKQIQSRFKNVDKTCREWGEYLLNIGLSLNKHQNTPSNWFLYP